VTTAQLVPPGDRQPRRVREQSARARGRWIPGIADKPLRTPGRIWFSPGCQVRIEILRDEYSGELSLRAAQWTELPGEWCPLHGISIGSLRELLALIFGLVKGWLILEMKRGKQ
jgi:hypothetical protein